MKSFSKKPWHVGYRNAEGSVFADSGRMRMESNGTTLYPVCRFGMGWNEDEDEANGNLIAAAPDLLEALEQARAALPDAWMAEKCGVPRDVIEVIDAAIAKAKGEMQ